MEKQTALENRENRMSTLGEKSSPKTFERLASALLATSLDAWDF